MGLRCFECFEEVGESMLALWPSLLADWGLIFFKRLVGSVLVGWSNHGWIKLLWLEFAWNVYASSNVLNESPLFIDYFVPILMSKWACLLLRNSNFEIMDCLSSVSVAGIWCSSCVIIQYTNIEISLKILRINLNDKNKLENYSIL